MTIIIPEDENVNEIVIDVRDVLGGAELEFNAEKEMNVMNKPGWDIVKNNFVTEFVFTMQKSDFEFEADEQSFIKNIKKILKTLKPKILDTFEEKYKRMKRILKYDVESNFGNSGKDITSKSNTIKRKFIKHIREQYSNIVDAERCQVMRMKKSDKIILGERVFSSSVQLVGVSAVNTSKRLGLDTPDLKNIKIGELGMCPENLLEATIDNMVKNKRPNFRFNRYIENRLKTNQDSLEI